MKKINWVFAAMVAMATASCGGQSAKTADDAEVTAAEESVMEFNQAQLEAAIKVQMDSLAKLVDAKKYNAILSEVNNGTAKLTADELKVKPDYLLNPSVANDATTFSAKYIALGMLRVDRYFANLYEMDCTEYDAAIQKLLSEVNDPAIKKSIDEGTDMISASQALYDGMEKEGRINFYWELSAAAVIENLYVMSQNVDRFTVGLTDDQVDRMTFHLVCILDALDGLSVYDPQIPGIAEALSPLKALNATSVAEFKKQLGEMKDQIKASREGLLK